MSSSNFDINSYISNTVPYDKVLFCAWVTRVNDCSHEPVGHRYFLQKLEKNNWPLGGNELWNFHSKLETSASLSSWDSESSSGNQDPNQACHEKSPKLVLRSIQSGFLTFSRHTHARYGSQIIDRFLYWKSCQPPLFKMLFTSNTILFH